MYATQTVITIGGIKRRKNTHSIYYFRTTVVAMNRFNSLFSDWFKCLITIRIPNKASANVPGSNKITKVIILNIKDLLFRCVCE